MFVLSCAVERLNAKDKWIAFTMVQTRCFFFYLETVLSCVLNTARCFFRAKLHLQLGNLNKLRGNLTKTVLFLCKKHRNAVLKTLESGVFYTTLYRSVASTTRQINISCGGWKSSMERLFKWVGKYCRRSKRRKCWSSPCIPGATIRCM